MKTCKHPPCTYPVFSNGYCQGHQRLRTDDKYIRTHKANRGIPKYTEKKKVTRVDFGFDSQTDLFNWLWDEAKDKNGIVVCPYTNERLNRFYNTEMWFQCFAHVLPKGRYTYWKLNPDNIRIVHPDFHKAIDQGTMEIRKKWTGWKFSEWDAEVEEMKIAYQQFKKQNLLA